MKLAKTMFLLIAIAACGGKGTAPAAAPAPAHAESHPANPDHADGHHEDGHHADGHHAGGHDHGEPADDADKPLVAAGSAVVGDRTTCPVTGETFVVSADSAKVEYEGKTYYFCCPGCMGSFQKDPTKYLAKTK